MKIGRHQLGPKHPVYCVAELSANHNHDFNQALTLIEQAHLSGADAIKLQTYTADTITINCRSEPFIIRGTRLWDDQSLYDLYTQASTPWEWHKPLQEKAHQLGMDFFSSPFDPTAVDFLESLNVPCYKIASCEITDHILLQKVAQTQKPVILSTGLASLGEIEAAINLLKKNGTPEICVLKCTVDYPADHRDANLRTIPHIANSFQTLVGLSDHTLCPEVPLVAVSLGACLIEKHLTLDRESDGPDAKFSMTPVEFRQMVSSIRVVEQSLGKITYGGTNSEKGMKKFRKSLFVVKDISAGEMLTDENIRAIRPGDGLEVCHYSQDNCKKFK